MTLNNLVPRTFSCVGYDPYNPNAFYEYCPSLPASILFTTLFSITALTHIFQAFYHRKPFAWVICFAASWEAVALGLRAKSTQNPYGSRFALPSQLLILLAPLLINAFDYMVLGRMIHYFLREKGVLGVKGARLSVYFVWLDVIAFLIQAAGGSIASNSGNSTSASTIMLGIHIYMGGIGFQLLWILVFSFIAFRFSQKATHESSIGDAVIREKGWSSLLVVLYITLGMVVIRIVYRLVEYAGGEYSSIARHEEFFYVFEATPMVIALFAWNFYHPGRILKGEESEFPKKDKAAKKAEKLAKKEEKRVRKEQKEMEKRMKKGLEMV